jgi:2-polyprenyl-6-methoxyphenol hydroxylase-like FAD-dependent oxidoreductase
MAPEIHIQPAPDGCARGCRVGIVGGSIAGCTAAIVLTRIGCEVTVFERSRGVLEERGAGIALPFAHLDWLKAHDLVDDDLSFVPSELVRWTHGADPGHEGRLLWRSPMASGGLKWSHLHAQQRKRVPDEIYHQGCSVAAFEERPGGPVVARLDDGRSFEFDLLIFADGYDSLGRAALFPDTAKAYTGYVVVRGLVEETHAPAELAEPPGTCEWAVHAGGLCIAYLVPGHHGERSPGRRLMNWAWYNVAAPQDLPWLLTDRYNRRHEGSLPRGGASDEHRRFLHERARTMLRGPLADAIIATAEPFMQVSFDLHVPSFVQGRVCLLGDASSIARPHVAAGALKAQQQAVALAEALASLPSIEAALQAWNEDARIKADQQIALGKTLGRALITDAPDWSAMDAQQMPSWWASATRGTYVYYFDDAKRGA